jgi:ketosteroid isomerase-like protein
MKILGSRLKPSTLTASTRTILGRHLQATLAGSIDDIMDNYAEDSVLYVSQGPVRGLDELRHFYETLLESRPASFAKAVEFIRQDVEEDVAFVVWRCGIDLPFATDTFLIRDGKIRVQTFASYTPS